MGTIQTHVRWFSQVRTDTPGHDQGSTITADPALADLTRAQLSHLAKERGLDTSGTKAELLERLSDG